jgi:hypothetical protein
VSFWRGCARLTESFLKWVWLQITNHVMAVERYRRQSRITNSLGGDCLARTSEPNNNDAVRIREGVRTRNGKMVWAGADACAVDLKIKRQWDKWSGGCADIEYVTIAKAEIEHGKALCDRYSQ